MTDIRPPNYIPTLDEAICATFAAIRLWLGRFYANK